MWWTHYLMEDWKQRYCWDIRKVETITPRTTKGNGLSGRNLDIHTLQGSNGSECVTKECSFVFFIIDIDTYSDYNGILITILKLSLRFSFERWQMHECILSMIALHATLNFTNCQWLDSLLLTFFTYIAIDSNIWYFMSYRVYK